MNRWRKRAEKLRMLAAQTRYRSAKEELLRIAAIHNGLADDAERRYQQQLARSQQPGGQPGRVK